MGRKLVEVERVVLVLEVLVEQIRVVMFADLPALLSKVLCVEAVLGGRRTRDEVNQSPRLSHSLGRVGNSARVVEHHLAEHAPLVPARVSVVADVSHPVGCEVPRQISRILSRTGAGTHE